MGDPYRTPPKCDHGVTFDRAKADAEGLGPYTVRERWPRLYGECPKRCGYKGIAYASWDHYIYGDW